MNGDSQIREANAADLDALRDLADGVPEAPHWPEAAYREALAGGDGAVRRLVLVVQTGAALGGFVVVSIAAGEAELESVVVTQRVRRQGIGSALCRAAMLGAGALGASVMRLEVRAASAGARALYHALGFRETGFRRAYYQNPADDAVLMARPIQQPAAAGEAAAAYNGEHGP